MMREKAYEKYMKKTEILKEIEQKKKLIKLFDGSYSELDRRFVLKQREQIEELERKLREI